MADAWPFFKLNWMGRDNDAVRVWVDVKLGRWWYVLVWRKGERPYAYRSLDATPPDRDNAGRWLLGRRYYRG